MKLFLLAAVFLVATGCQQKSGSSAPVKRFDENPTPQGSCLLSGSDGPDDSTAGIINGQPLSSSSRIAKGTVFVVALQVLRGVLVESHCTGVLIGPKLVVTAAHCVPAQSNLTDEERGQRTRVFFTVDPNCDMIRAEDPSYMRESAKVKVHAGYDADEHINDLALIFLESNAPTGTRALPMYMADTEIPTRQEIYVAGYGRDTDLSSGVSSSPRLRFTTLFQTTDANAPSRVGTRPDNDLVILDADHGTGVCSGDSGGPALVTLQGKLHAVGIASFVYDHEWQRATCLSRAAFTRLAAFQDWLTQNGGRAIRGTR